MNISTRLPTTADSEWTLLVKILLTLQAGGGGGGGGTGSTLFGDPGGSTIPGEVAYDGNGNVWVDLDPSGSHNWQKVVTAESAAAPMMLAVPAPVADMPEELKAQMAALSDAHAQALESAQTITHMRSSLEVLAEQHAANVSKLSKLSSELEAAAEAQRQIKLEQESSRNQLMVVAPLTPATLETPKVVLPPSRWVKFRNAISKATVWIATVLHL